MNLGPTSTKKLNALNDTTVILTACAISRNEDITRG